MSHSKRSNSFDFDIFLSLERQPLLQLSWIKNLNDKRCGYSEKLMTFQSFGVNKNE